MSTDYQVDRDVRQALKNAEANGVTFEGMTSYEIACDMANFDAALDETSPSVIQHFIEKIRAEPKVYVLNFCSGGFDDYSEKPILASMNKQTLIDAIPELEKEEVEKNTIQARFREINEDMHRNHYPKLEVINTPKPWKGPGKQPADFKAEREAKFDANEVIIDRNNVKLSAFFASVRFRKLTVLQCEFKVPVVKEEFYLDDHFNAEKGTFQIEEVKLV